MKHLLLLIALLAPVSHAETVAERLQKLLDTAPGGSAGEILNPEQAFIFNAHPLGPDQVLLSWQVAEGYYLYRHRFGVSSADVKLGEWQAPRGKLKQDAAFGEVEVNIGLVEFVVPLLERQVSRADFEIAYQGCKEGAICYPPIKKTVSLTFPDSLPAVQTGALGAAPAPMSAQDQITERLKNSGLLLNMFAFFLFGLLLSLTPCVFPMIPILSGIIVGQSATLSPTKGLTLSLIYVASMALIYALLGILAASFQINIQAAAQNIWAISAFSLVFVLLALSMFGLYPLQLPTAIQTRLYSALDSQAGGSWHGVALMGALSAIIVGPCVAPPLAGALLYISQTGDAALGGAALFCMGMGFGVPLLLVGTSAGYLLPRAGAWMESIKTLFGIIMLGVAVWFMERVIPTPAALLLWGALCIGSALYLGALSRAPTGWKKCGKGLGIILLIYGISLVVGAIAGANDKFRPLQPFTGTVTKHHALPFKRVETLRDLNDEIRMAGANSNRVMLDFYADWCVACIEMERKTFTDTAVRQKLLSSFVLLQVDVTANNAEDQTILSHFNLYGPPAMLFFDINHTEFRNMRLLGFVPPATFLEHLHRVSP
ncbi:MAG: protein-disulfide reductase DsbD [Gammaproteobacteria bacterium]